MAQGGSMSGGATSSAGAATASGGATGGAGAASGGATGGAVGGSGAASTAGTATTGGAAAGAPSGKGGSAGAATAGAGAGGVTASTGGSSGSKSTGGATSAGAGGTSGATSAGAGGAPAGGSGGGSATGCSRELLQGTLDAYFKALAAHDASTLPLASPVKFTENGKALELGKDGLWKSAGMVKYSQTALDTETCNSASHAVVPDGTTDIPFALRIRLVAQKITEVETIAARPGDYMAVASNPAAIIASGDTVKWQDSVPAAQRNSRAEVTAWIDKYFRIFPSGVCNTTSSCRRLENGGGNFSCSGGATCRAGDPGSGTPALNPRLLLADVERGIGVGFTVYQGHTDMHMYKMYGGQIYAVHALLALGSAGW